MSAGGSLKPSDGTATVGGITQPGRYLRARYRKFACRQSVVAPPPLLAMAPGLALQSVGLLVTH